MSGYVQFNQQASLPGILGFIQNQMGNDQEEHRSNPPTGGSFAAFYESSEEFKTTDPSAVRSESSEDTFERPLGDADGETVVTDHVRTRKEQIKLQDGRYDAHRKASKIQEGYGLAEVPLRVPRDAQTEKRCQMFSVFVTLISLLAIFFFAMTKPVWTTTRFLEDDALQADHYKGLCDISGVIPLEGTAECNSIRSRENTQVYCKITCTHGLNEGAVDINFILNGDGRSFNLTCDKSISEWTYDVNKICLPEPTE